MGRPLLRRPLHRKEPAVRVKAAFGRDDKRTGDWAAGLDLGRSLRQLVCPPRTQIVPTVLQLEPVHSRAGRCGGQTVRRFAPVVDAPVSRKKVRRRMPVQQAVGPAKAVETAPPGDAVIGVMKMR